MDGTPQRDTTGTGLPTNTLDRHKDNFERAAFPEGVTVQLPRSKMLSPDSWAHRIFVLQHWPHGTDTMSVKEFRQHNKSGYQFIKQFTLKSSDEDVQLLSAMEGSVGKIVVHKQQVFSIINEGGMLLSQSLVKRWGSFML